MSTSKWYRAWKSGGTRALEQRKATGRPRFVGVEAIREYLSDADMTDHTTESLAAELSMRFGVDYNNDHVGKILNRLGFRWSGKGWKRE